MFIIGAPRSGTTYLVNVLNRHPEIFITNETRVMTWANRALNVLPENRWILARHRDEFLAHMRTELGAVIHRFYLSLGAPPFARWGDKNPHYADRKTDPACLMLIDEIFPDSQFIHLVRDAPRVVESIVRKGWAPLDQALDVWRRHVQHGRDFGQSIGSERYIELRYEDLLAAPQVSARRLLEFLRLPPSEEVTTFLKIQAEKPSPFSNPTSSLRDPSAAPVSDEVAAAVAEVEDLRRLYGYV